MKGAAVSGRSQRIVAGAKRFEPAVSLLTFQCYERRSSGFLSSGSALWFFCSWEIARNPLVFSEKTQKRPAVRIPSAPATRKCEPPVPFHLSGFSDLDSVGVQTIADHSFGWTSAASILVIRLRWAHRLRSIPWVVCSQWVGPPFRPAPPVHIRHLEELSKFALREARRPVQALVSARRPAVT